MMPSEQQTTCRVRAHPKEDEMSIAASVGVPVGIMVGLILCVIWFKFANNNKKVKTDYDERQEMIRNRGYKYAFYTVLFYEALLMILAIGRIELPMSSYAVHFLGIILGCIVLCEYCVWKDAYWGLNNNRKRYIIIFAFTAALNVIPIAGGIAGGTLIEDGKIGMPMLNIMVLVMLAVVCITMVIKQIRDKSAVSEEEED